MDRTPIRIGPAGWFIYIGQKIKMGKKMKEKLTINTMSKLIKAVEWLGKNILVPLIFAKILYFLLCLVYSTFSIVLLEERYYAILYFFCLFYIKQILKTKEGQYFVHSMFFFKFSESIVATVDIPCYSANFLKNTIHEADQIHVKNYLLTVKTYNNNPIIRYAIKI